MWQKHEPRASTEAKLQLSEPTGKPGGCGAHSPLRGTVCRRASRMGQGRLARCPTQNREASGAPAGARAMPVKHRAMGTAPRIRRKGRSANLPPASDLMFTISTLCYDARDPLPRLPDIGYMSWRARAVGDNCQMPVGRGASAPASQGEGVCDPGS